VRTGIGDLHGQLQRERKNCAARGKERSSMNTRKREDDKREKETRKQREEEGGKRYWGS
jgi:hypothetical protein